jgi:hypothetical protein
MLSKESTKETLQAFSKYVIQQSRTNLTKGNKNVSKDLYNSLDSEINVSKNSFGLSFKMADYGKFQDKGVQGVGSNENGPKGEGNFKFGSGTGKKGGLTQGINQWVRARGFQFKDKKTGRFLSYDSTAFLITRSVYHKGMKATKFFSRPFELGFERLPDDIIEAYGLDVERFLKNTLK